jgi:hypothetical protein
MDVVWGGISQGRDIRTVSTDLMAYLKGGPEVVKGRWGKLEPGTREYARRLGSKGIDYRVMRIYRSEIHRNQQEAAVKEGEDNPACTGEYDWILMPGRGTFLCNCPELAAGGPYTKETIPDYPHPNCDCMVEPRLKDSDDLIRDLKDYVNGVPSEGANEISLWAQQYELGEDIQAIRSPETPPASETPLITPTPKEMPLSSPPDEAAVEKTMNDEMARLRSLGKKTGKERLTIMTQAGKNAGSWQGGKDHVTISTRIRNILENAPANSLTPIHNHPGSNSFSIDDFDVMCSYDSIKELRVIGHNGTRYRMIVGSGQRVTREELEKFENFIYNRAMQEVGNKTTQGIRTNYFSERNRFMAEHFGWKYEEEKPSGKKK